LTCFINRKVIAGVAHETGSFSLTMNLYEDNALSDLLMPHEEVALLSNIYVSIEMEIDPSNTRFFVQVNFIRHLTVELVVLGVKYKVTKIRV